MCSPYDKNLWLTIPGVETAAFDLEEGCCLCHLPSWRLVSYFLARLRPLLIFDSAFFAGLANAIIQGVYLTQPEFAMDASGGSFFEGT